MGLPELPQLDLQTQGTPRESSGANPLLSPLISQFETAIPLILANGWIGNERLAILREQAGRAMAPLPGAGRSLISQFLVDAHALTRDQAADLDVLVRHQTSLPAFELLRKLGSGGMGTVFLARERAHDRLVALKTMNARLAEDRDFVERFHREADALAQIHHPHIAGITASGETDGTCWLAMEYIQGPSLMTLLKEHQVLPEIYALTIVRQIAEGLESVWSTAKLVHRDIKPENILVVRPPGVTDPFPCTDQAKLIDFGLVKSNNEDDRLTQTGMTIGTPLYMSPEQVRGDKLDCRSDIYGLGATLYHLLTGSTPFKGNSPGAIMSAHLTEPVPDPGERTPALREATRRLVMTSMVKVADKRYSSFTAFISGCDEALAELDVHSDAPRLLRKPMVRKNPIRRSGEFASETPVENRELPAPPAPLPPVTLPHLDGPPAPPPVSPDKNAVTVLSVVDRTPIGGASILPELPPVILKPEPSPPPAPPPAPMAAPPAPAKPAPRAPSDRLVPPVPEGPIGARPTDPVAARNPAVKSSTIVRKPVAKAAPKTADHRRNDGTASRPRNPSTEEVPVPMKQLPVPIQRSKSMAYVDPPPTPGIGLLPWVVLGVALLALIALIAFTTLF